MKNLILCVVFLCSILHMAAQSKNGKNRPDGKYTEYNKNRTVYSEKYYDNGKRTGTWIIHQHDSSTLTGVYKNDTLVSRLLMKPEGDTLIYERFEYERPSDNKPLTCNYYIGTVLKTKTLLKIEGRDSIVEVIDSIGDFALKALRDSIRSKILGRLAKAEFKINFTAYIMDNLKYPKNAKDYGIEGECIIAFIVKADGSVSFPRVSRSSGDKSLDEEAMRLITQSTGMWIPATNDGFLYSSLCAVYVTFTLDDE